MNSVMMIDLAHDIATLKKQGGIVLRGARAIGEALCVLRAAQSGDDLSWLGALGISQAEFMAFVDVVRTGKFIMGGEE